MHKGIHSQKFVEKRRKRIQALLFLAVLCVVTILAAFILLLRVPFFQIKEIVVEGSTHTPPEIVSKVALGSLSGNYLGVIPHSSTLFYSKKRITKALEDNFKQINVFTVHRKGINGLRLTIEERMPTAIVCPGFRDEAEQGQCYLSDTHGYIFGSMATSTPQNLFSSLNYYYVPTEQGVISAGNNFIPEKRFSDLQKFMNGALRGGLLPLGVLISEGGEYEMYIKNKKGDSEVTVYFDDRSPFERTLLNLLTFWDNGANGKKATTTPAFDYINLRFGNTVYYSTQ